MDTGETEEKWDVVEVAVLVVVVAAVDVVVAVVE